MEGEEEEDDDDSLKMRALAFAYSASLSSIDLVVFSANILALRMRTIKHVYVRVVHA